MIMSLEIYVFKKDNLDSGIIKNLPLSFKSKWKIL